MRSLFLTGRILSPRYDRGYSSCSPGDCTLDANAHSTLRSWFSSSWTASHFCSRARPASRCAIALWLFFGIGRTSAVKLLGSMHAVRIVLTAPSITAPPVSIVSTSVLHRSATVFFWNSGNKWSWCGRPCLPFCQIAATLRVNTYLHDDVTQEWPRNASRHPLPGSGQGVIHSHLRMNVATRMPGSRHLPSRTRI